MPSSTAKAITKAPSTTITIKVTTTKKQLGNEITTETVEYATSCENSRSKTPNMKLPKPAI